MAISGDSTANGAQQHPPTSPKFATTAYDDANAQTANSTSPTKEAGNSPLEKDGIDNGNATGNGNENASNGEAATPPVLEAQDDQRQRRSKTKVALIMSSLCIAVLLVALDITIVTTALPTIAEEFKSASGYTWIGSAYLIANSAATPIWGKVSDIFGRKPILLVTNAIFFIGSLLAAVSVNMNMLIASRAVQGIGGGGLIVLVNICISDLFPMRERGAYFGMIGGVWALVSWILLRCQCF